jgi:hypothetical protein
MVARITNAVQDGEQIHPGATANHAGDPFFQPGNVG